MAYEINININGDIDDVGSVGMSSASLSDKKTKTSSAGSNLIKYISAQTIEPLVNKTINFVASNVELTTGSRELQEKTDFVMQGVSVGMNAFKNAQGGAVITAAMGLGAGLGAGIGLALSGLSIAMDIMFKQRQIDLRAQIEDRQIKYLSNRAGPAFNASRRGNV